MKYNNFLVNFDIKVVVPFFFSIFENFRPKRQWYFLFFERSYICPGMCCSQEDEQCAAVRSVQRENRKVRDLQSGLEIRIRNPGECGRGRNPVGTDPDSYARTTTGTSSWHSVIFNSRFFNWQHIYIYNIYTNIIYIPI